MISKTRPFQDNKLQKIKKLINSRPNGNKQENHYPCLSISSLFNFEFQMAPRIRTAYAHV